MAPEDYLADLDRCQHALLAAIAPDRLVIVAYGRKTPFFAHPWSFHLLHWDARGTAWIIPVPTVYNHHPGQPEANPRLLWDAIQHAQQALTLAPTSIPPAPWRRLPSSLCEVPDLYQALDS